ncbi:MAG: YcxB family protein [Parvularculaceae bacterium]|nr:YcxB family protein [Parvularculaceae bacterium]
MQLSGTIRVGEANNLCAELMRRRRGPDWRFYILLLFCLPFGYAVTWFTFTLLGIGNGAMTLGIGTVCGILIYSALSKRLVLYFTRRQYASSYGSSELTFAVTLSDEAFLIKVGDVSYSAPWRAITEATVLKGYWLVFAPGLEAVFPQRAFKDGEEDAFQRELQRLLSPEALERSSFPASSTLA